MKRKILIAFLISLIYTNRSISQNNFTELKIDKQVEFKNGVGLNLASKYLNDINSYSADSYVIIRTNMDYINSNGSMTSFRVNYWGYTNNWEMVVGFYVWNNDFVGQNAYCVGIHQFDHLKIFNENGKVSVAIPRNAFNNYGSITVHKDVSNLATTNPNHLNNWTISHPTQVHGTNIKHINISSPSLNTNVSEKNIATHDLVLSANRILNLNSKDLRFTNAGNIAIGDQTTPLIAKLSVNANTVTNGLSPLHGIFSTLTANQNQDQYGIFSRVLTSGGTGKRYGIYSEVPFGASNFAAYFKGKTQVRGDIIQEGGRGSFIFHQAWLASDMNFISITPQKLSNEVDFNSSLTLRENGELIKGINSNSLKAFSVFSHILSKDVFRVMGDGKVYATEINVRLASEFPDYVFEDSYKLLSLKSLETYIQENKKLPNMPSAKEVGNKGMNVGQINTLLVEKVEELTLYTIQQQKLIDELMQRIDKIENK